MARREEPAADAAAVTGQGAAAETTVIEGGAAAAPAPAPTPAPRRKKKAKGWYCPVCRQPYTSLLRLALPASKAPATPDEDGTKPPTRAPSIRSVRTTRSTRSVAPTLPPGAEEMLARLPPGSEHAHAHDHDHDHEDEDDEEEDEPEAERPQFVEQVAQPPKSDIDAAERGEAPHVESVVTPAPVAAAAPVAEVPVAAPVDAPAAEAVVAATPATAPLPETRVPDVAHTADADAAPAPKQA